MRALAWYRRARARFKHVYDGHHSMMSDEVRTLLWILVKQPHKLVAQLAYNRLFSLRSNFRHNFNHLST